MTLRVLTLSSLFPDATRPVFGSFVERQTRALAARPDVALRVVAPIGLPPSPLDRLERYQSFRALPLVEDWKGLTIYRPRFLHWPGMAGRFDPHWLAHALRPVLAEILADFPFDVIDAEFFFPDGPAAVRLGEVFGVPISIKARGSDIRFWGQQPATRPHILEAGKRAQSLLAVSAALKADMVALGMPEERIHVHYTGLDQALYKPGDKAAEKARLGIKGDLVAAVGTLNENKGHAITIKALEQLPGASLVLIGKGPDRAALEKQAKAAGLGERVLFPGSLPAERVAQWLRAADVMALPSASEGLANAWIEALACGTPVVTCDVGGAAEVIDRPAAGRLVPRTAACVAEGIRALIDQPPPQKDICAAAARFSWEANSSALFERLSSLVGR